MVQAVARKPTSSFSVLIQVYKMHIKQAIIEGYKSYKDQTISEPFDQHINVVGMPLGSMYGKKMFGPFLQ
ncbi:hypothetical protein CVIRNUC_006715 [Coccomyxa viridis]|uniref:Uncharacterized protein n=1 Tax=Coccomyxa viridis TaxID=1274662 RepID=A0AAV1I9W9_9CHLO|nr:hypothetical protein CVIRNUC_006715 [Coccomyxa viridis]